MLRVINFRVDVTVKDSLERRLEHKYPSLRGQIKAVHVVRRAVDARRNRLDFVLQGQGDVVGVARLGFRRAVHNAAHPRCQLLYAVAALRPAVAKLHRRARIRARLTQQRHFRLRVADEAVQRDDDRALPHIADVVDVRQQLTPLLAKYLSDEEKRQRRLVHIPMGRFGTSEEMVQGALFLASDESSFMTGQSLLIDGGITAAYTTPE